MEKKQRLIGNFFLDNNNLFKLWKDIDTLISNQSTEVDYSLAALNNVSSILLYLNRAASSQDDKIEEQILSAKTSLHALVKESYVILQSILVKEINDELKDCSQESISNMWPKYHSEVVPKMDLIRNGIKDIDSTIDPTSNEEVWKNIVYLLEVKTQITTIKPNIKKFEEEKKTEKIKDQKFQLKLALYTGILGLILGALITIAIAYFNLPH